VERISQFVDIENERPLTIRNSAALKRFIAHLAGFLTRVSTAVDAKLSQDKKLIKKSRKIQSK
jgi:hypothetical protein